MRTNILYFNNLNLHRGYFLCQISYFAGSILLFAEAAAIALIFTNQFVSNSGTLRLQYILTGFVLSAGLIAAILGIIAGILGLRQSYRKKALWGLVLNFTSLLGIIALELTLLFSI